MSKNNNNQTSKTANSGGSLRERLEQELTEKFPQEVLDQTTGRTQSPDRTTKLERGRSLRPGQERAQQKIAEEKSRRHRLHQQLEKETNLRLREKQTFQTEIVKVREEIHRLTETIDSAQNQVEKTVVAAETIPEKADSQYHVSFLQFLLKFLKNLRQQAVEGEVWLQAFQERHQKKNPFWNRVKQSGAKFLLAPDRTPSTQAA